MLELRARHSTNYVFLAESYSESEGGASQFIKLKLRAKPSKEDEVWSDWVMATQRADLSPVPEAERIAVRYRVQPEE